jgi:hypothetical protein
MLIRTVVLAGLAAACAGCSRPPLKAALADCRVEARRHVGLVQDPDPWIADCMDGKGYEIRAAECSTIESPAQLEGCYRSKDGGAF